jgi:hypothetical protein
MWYWDYTPSSHHSKKPLTKAQIRRLQEAYSRADEISAEVREKEQEEQKISAKETEEMLKFL